MKKFLLLAAGALMGLSASAQWAVVGAYCDWSFQSAATLEGSGNDLSCTIDKLTSGFKIVDITNNNWDVQYGTSTPIEVGTPYVLDPKVGDTDPSDISFANDVFAVENAQVNWNPSTYTLEINGTPVQQEVDSSVLYIVGTPNDWNINESDYVLHAISDGVYQGSFYFGEGSEIYFRFYTALGNWASDGALPSIGPLPNDNTSVEVSFTDGVFDGSCQPGKGSWYISTWTGGEINMEVDINNWTVKFSTENDITPTPSIPDELYIIGDIENVGWTPGNPLPFSNMGNGYFTINNVTLNAETSYFSFTNIISEDWNVINDGFHRYGPLNSGEPMSVGYYNEMRMGGDVSWTIPAGTYNFYVDFNRMGVLAEVATSSSPTWSVYYSNPDGWDEVCIYSWIENSDGSVTQLTGGWPGYVMKQNDEGLWYYEGYGQQPQFVIFNNNNNGLQTENLVFENGKTYDEGDRNNYDPDKAWTVYYTNPEGWEEVYAYAYGENGMNLLGYWPGVLCNYDESTGLWSVSGSGYPSYIIFNNQWGEQTVDLPIVNDRTYTSGKVYWYELYFKAPENWEQPLIHLTDGNVVWTNTPFYDQERELWICYANIDAILDQVYFTDGLEGEATPKYPLENYATYTINGIYTGPWIVYYTNPDNWTDVFVYTSNALTRADEKVLAGQATYNDEYGVWVFQGEGYDQPLYVTFGNGSGEETNPLPFVDEKLYNAPENSDNIEPDADWYAYYTNPQGWDEVYVWLWNNEMDGEEFLGEGWPGIPAQKQGKLWYIKGDGTMPEYIIFNNKNQGQQTDNLLFVNGKLYTNHDKDSWTVYFTNPEEWTEVYAYAYNYNGEPLIGNYPGTLCEYDAATGNWKVSGRGLPGLILFNNGMGEGTNSYQIIDGYTYDVPSQKDIEVYFEAPLDWTETVTAWFYFESEESWHGRYAYYDPESNLWIANYVYSEWPTLVVFEDGLNADKQTPYFEFVNRATYNIDGMVSEEPEPEPEPGEDYPTLYLKTANGNVAFISNGDGTYTLDYVQFSGSDTSFSFYTVDEDNQVAEEYGPYITDENFDLLVPNPFTIGLGHSWTIAAGGYSFTVDLNSMFATGKQVFGGNPIPAPMTLYIIGDFEIDSWNSYISPELSQTTDGVFFGEDLTLTDSGDGYAYFTFASILGDWDIVNLYRYSPVSAAHSIAIENMPTPFREFNGEGAASWAINPGTYNVVVNFNNQTVRLADPAGIDSIGADFDGDNDAMYNLQGVRVDRNHVIPGIYIVNGRKVVVK